jgi:hypothetical protein
VVVESGMSDVNKMYKVGPNTLPCGTPDFIGCSSEFSFPLLLGIVGHLGNLSRKKSGGGRNCLILYSRPLCHTL